MDGEGQDESDEGADPLDGKKRENEEDITENLGESTSINKREGMKVTLNKY